MNFGSTSRLGLSLYETSDPIEQWPGQSSGDAAVIIRAVYKQVLGNAHIMDSERLASAESKFSDGELSVREFVRAVGRSSLYASLFGDRPRFRQIELGYKHFLGRAPNDYSEMQAGTAVLDSGSFDDLIDFFVDSEEYKSTFGNDTVPYIRGYKTEALSTNAGFSYMFDLLRGPATSDAAAASALNGAISKEQPRPISLSYRKPNILPYSPPAGYQLPTTPVATPAATPAPAFAAASGTFRAVTTQASADIAASASSRLGYAPYANSTPIEVWPGQSDADKNIAIRAAYKQVLGNAHVMDSERLTVPESQFKRGELSLREFVRAIGNSDLYQSRFGDCSRFRKIELAYKHFLGRAPNDYSEMQTCTAILDSGSFSDLIDYFVDCDEFQSVFGQDTVPFIRGYATEAAQTAAGFPYTLQLLTGPASSDIGAASRLNASIINATPELPISRYPVSTSGKVPAARLSVPVGAPGQTTASSAGSSGQAPLFSGDSAGKLGFFGRILNFVEQLTGGDSGGDASVTAEQPKEEFFLNPDDARSLGDVEYMRTPRTIKRTFPNAADPEKPLEFEAVVTASQKVISPEKDKPTGLPSVTPTKPKDVKIPVVTPTPAAGAPAQTSAPAPAVSASLMEFGTTASRAGKSGPYVSMSMSPEVSSRRKKDNSLDMFRKMATDLRKSE
ncbi:MAG: phycobilisome rod-core linker polypeptide [Cyanobacteria bacterium P01_A01_bin.3]